MNRQGIKPEEIKTYIKLIGSYKNLELEGACSHFADSDGEDDYFTKMQEKIFDQSLDAIRKAGFNPRFVHLSNTAGVIKTIQIEGKIKIPMGTSILIGAA